MSKNTFFWGPRGLVAGTSGTSGNRGVLNYIPRGIGEGKNGQDLGERGPQVPCGIPRHHPSSCNALRAGQCL